MKIDILAKHEPVNFSLYNIIGEKITQNSAKDGWYQIQIPYVDKKIEVSDIKIDDVSIAHILYTGYTQDKTGRKIQTTAVWEHDHVFKIWIHTNTGVLFDRVFRQIQNGDFGKNLFEKYVLTVSRPTVLSSKFNKKLQNFFGFGDGPNWWRLDSELVPYKIMSYVDIDQKHLLNQLQNICKYDDVFHSKGFIKCLYPADNEECFNVTDIENSYLQTLCRKIGYKKIQNIFLSKLEPYGSIDIHIDDHISKPELKGCTKFYYQLSNTEGTFFKLGQSGLLPLDHPLLINTSNHTHAVANDSAQSRMVCYMYGQL